MNVLVNNRGERIAIYRPYINLEETSRSVTITTPEESHNTGLYTREPVDHLTGNSSAGLWTDDVKLVNHFYGMTPYTKVEPKESYAASLPNTYTTPRNMFLKENYHVPKYRTLAKIYGTEAKQGPGMSGLISYN